MVCRALEARGIDRLYTHQAEAIGHALAGRHVVVVTPTASGKTLGYNAPIRDSVLRDPSSRALYLFPTKRSRRTSSPSCRRSAIGSTRRRESRSASSRTTATRPRTRGDRSARGRTSC